MSDQQGKVTRVAIAATFTAEPVEESLRFWLDRTGRRAEIQFAPFNQVFQQLLNPTGCLGRGALDVVLVRIEDWLHPDQLAGAGLTAAFLDGVARNVRELIGAVTAAATRSSVPLLVCFCPASPALLADTERAALLERQQQLAGTQLASRDGVVVCSQAELASLYPVDPIHDPYADDLGRIPYTRVFFTALGTLIARRLRALTTPPCKVIVLDCDETLWKGVVGEDGVDGIEIDPGRRALQTFVVAQAHNGVLVCLCSKNNESDVVEVFARRADMVLQREHVTAWRINWRPKSENLAELAAELNLGLDSFVFVDDSAIEVAEVAARCPQVLALQLPARADDIPRFLNHLWPLDRIKVLEADRQRAELYRRERQRDQVREQAPSLAEFVNSLNLEIEVAPLEDTHLPRIAQLTQRTNQFNATTVRRSEAELRELLRAGYACLATTVRDRFGDYGLVGALLVHEDGAVLRVDTFLVSCRALGRGVEHRMLARLGQVAIERGLRAVEIPFVETAKNQPAHDFLRLTAGPFQELRDGRIVFALPADVAAGAAFRPEQQPPPPEAKERTIASSPAPDQQPTDRGDRDLLRDVAERLWDPVTIVAQLGARRHADSSARSQIVARTPTERAILHAVAELVGGQRVGMEDDLLQLGFQSLIMIQLGSRIREELGVSLSMRELFEEPTVLKLAAAVDANVIEQVDEAELEAALAEVCNLSPEEVRALLEGEP